MIIANIIVGLALPLLGKRIFRLFVGTILLYLLFDWTLIVLSSFAGAAFISQTIQFSAIPSAILLAALFPAGVIIQGSMLKKGKGKT